MNRHVVRIFLMLVSAAFSSCFSARKGEPKAELERVPQAPVIAQVGKSAPIAAPKPRQFYVDLRQAKAPLMRLHGTLSTGDADVAETQARAYLAKHPGDLSAITMLAASLVMTKKYDLAAYYAGEIEALRPGDPQATNIKALAILLAPGRRIGELRKARELFKSAFDADPSQLAPGLNLGSLELELGDAASALATFEDVASRCNRCTAALMGLGIAASRTRDFAKATKTFEEVLHRNPKHSYALYNLALVYKNGYNDKKRAETELYVLLDEARPDDSYIRGRAQTLLRMLKGEKSTEERTAIADDPGGHAPSEESPDAKTGAPDKSEADSSDAELLMSEFKD